MWLTTCSLNSLLTVLLLWYSVTMTFNTGVSPGPWANAPTLSQPSHSGPRATALENFCTCLALLSPHLCGSLPAMFTSCFLRVCAFPYSVDLKHQTSARTPTLWPWKHLLEGYLKANRFISSYPGLKWEFTSLTLSSLQYLTSPPPALPSSCYSSLKKNSQDAGRRDTRWLSDWVKICIKYEILLF